MKHHQTLLSLKNRVLQDLRALTLLNVALPMFLGHVCRQMNLRFLEELMGHLLILFWQPRFLFLSLAFRYLPEILVLLSVFFIPSLLLTLLLAVIYEPLFEIPITLNFFMVGAECEEIYRF